MASQLFVRNVLEGTSGLSWEPMVMWRALCDNTEATTHSMMSTMKAIDRLACCEVSSINFFFTLL